MATASIENLVLGKLTYGITPADRAGFKRLGFAKWLDDQLDPAKRENAFVLDTLTKFPSLSLSPAEAHDTFPYSIKNHLVADEVIFSTLVRRYWSDRQVVEMLVEFLHDYNPVPRRSDDYSMAHYDNQVIRANVLGNYPDLVLASSRSPGMLDYLNGNQNDKNHPNENYGRELLELFTVTTAYPYTQEDVVNAARVLTGIVYPSAQPDLIVRVSQHWNGPVQVLGWSNPNPGGSRQAILATSESLIRYLANHSATAQAFSLRMARRFVSDNPPSSLVTAMAATYTKTSGNIPAVFKTMALSSEFAASYRAKTKRPSEFFGSVIRGLNLKPSKPITAGDPTKSFFFAANPLNELVSWLIQAGHLPTNWPFPNGYPDTAAPWTTMAAQVGRWNRVSSITKGLSSGSLTSPNFKSLLGNPKTSEQIVDAAARNYLGSALPADERAAAIKLINQIDWLSSEAAIEARIQVAVALVMSKPEWNLR